MVDGQTAAVNEQMAAVLREVVHMPLFVQC